MNHFIIYLLKATVCLSVFGVFFRLLLLKETFFKLTRFTLLIGLMICSILPLIRLSITSKSSVPSHFLLKDYITQRDNPNTELAQTNNYNTPPLYAIDNLEEQSLFAEKESGNKTISWFNIIVSIYWLGVALILLRLGISLIRLRMLIKRNKVIKHNKHLLVIFKDEIAPFSFFNYIAISEEDYKNNPVEIILHESIHIQKGHNIDLILSEMLLTLHWFNPIMWMINRDLREIHEYETDDAVIAEGISAQKYQLLLLKKAVGEKQFSSVINSFNQSKLKNRITMMLKTKSTPLARLKVLFAVPLVAVALLAFATVDIPNNDKLERQRVADYFMSFKNELGQNKYDAYLYISKSNHLHMIVENTDNNMIKSTDINNKDKLYKSFVELIDNVSRSNSSNTISIAFGADDDLEMKSVTIVKDVIRKSFDKWQSSISDDDKDKYDKGQMMTLSIKLIASKVEQDNGSVKLAQSNPLFYWQLARDYFDKSGITKKEINTILRNSKNNIIPILVNSINQTLIIDYKVLDASDLNSDNTIEAFSKLIVDKWRKNKEQLFFSLQYDISADSDIILQIVKYTVPAAYDLAIQEISDKDRISLEELKSKMPLLLISANEKVYNPTQHKKSDEPTTIISLHSVSGISEEKKLILTQAIDSTFPRNMENSIKEYKAKYGNTELNNMVIKLSMDVSLDDVNKLEKSINKELNIKNISYLLMTP